MTPQELRQVVTLADDGHFGHAAEACQVSQPTLSTQLRKLENSLGVVPFERTNKALRMTPSAERSSIRRAGCWSRRRGPPGPG